MRSAFAMVGALLLHAASLAQTPATDTAGTWDLTWQARKGPPRKTGYMVIEQKGAELSARIYGQGSVKAKGSIAGARFTLRGSRMAVPYTIDGHVQGNRLTGSLKILTVERHFTGQRRTTR